MFKETCNLLHINKIQTTAYHPQSNGIVERSHRTLVSMLKCFVDLPYLKTGSTLPVVVTKQTVHEYYTINLFE